MAVRNLAYELAVGGAGVAPHIVKGLQNTSAEILKLDGQAANLRETLKGQNAQLKAMRGAGQQGTQEYIDLQAAAGETKMELGLVGKAQRKLQHDQRVGLETARQYRAVLLRTGAAAGVFTGAVVGISAAVIGVARNQRELAQQARTAGVSFYDYSAQLNANTLALDGNAAAGAAASRGLIDASRQTRLFSVGLADIDTTSLAIAGVDLERFMAAARDPSGRELGAFLRRQYQEIDRISDATERQRRLDALRVAIGGDLFALAEKTASLTDAEYARNNELARLAAANAESRREAFESLNATLAETSLAFDNIKTTLAGIAAPNLDTTFGEWNEFLRGANEFIKQNQDTLVPAFQEVLSGYFPGLVSPPDMGPAPDDSIEGRVRDWFGHLGFGNNPEMAEEPWRPEGPRRAALPPDIAAQMAMQPEPQAYGPSPDEMGRAWEAPPVVENVPPPPVMDAPMMASAGPQSVTNNNGGNTFYVTIDSVAGENQTPEEAGQSTVEAIDYWLARSTSSR